MAGRDDMTEKIVPTQEGGYARFVFLAILVCCFISMIALVLAAVSLSKDSVTTINTGGTSSDGEDPDETSSDDSSDNSDSDDDKIWMFAIGHDGTNLEYIDDISGTLRGFHVDIVNEVCELANKNCRLVWDIYQNCWDSAAGELPRGGVGLMGGWYDACTGWFNTYERSRTLSFTDAFRSGLNGVFYVRLTNPDGFDPTNVTGKNIAFLDGAATDEHCLARNADAITGAMLDSANIFHYASMDQIRTAVENGEVDAAFANDNMFTADELLMVGDKYSNCQLSGGAMMARKDSDLNSWWNPAFERLRESSRYQAICDMVENEHAAQSGQTSDDLCDI